MSFLHPYHSFRHDRHAFANSEIRRVVFARDNEGIPVCIVTLADDYRDGKTRLDGAQIDALTSAFGPPLNWVGQRLAVSVKVEQLGEHSRASIVVTPLRGAR